MILNRGEKNALRRFSRDNHGYQAVSKWKGIGLPSMRSLCEKGLVVEGQSGIFGPTFKLTPLGLVWRERIGVGERRRRVSASSIDTQATNKALTGEPVLA